MRTRSFLLLLLPLVASTGAAAAQVPTPTSGEKPAAVRPPRSPVVAVGSRITWNVPYLPGGTEQQTLDVYAPPGVHDAPVVVYVHRGEWARGDKSEVSYKPKLLNENGIVLVSVNYRLSGVARHPAQVDDVAAALRWVRDHIAEHGGSPRRIVLMGHSAGCHIAALVGLDPRPLAKVGMRPEDLSGVVCWSGGAYDLGAKVAEQGMYERYIRENFGEDEAAWKDASPLAHVDQAPPGTSYLFVSAAGDKDLSRELTRRMAAGIREHGGRASALTLPDKTHFTADHDCGMPGDPGDTGAILLDFVQRATSAEPD